MSKLDRLKNLSSAKVSGTEKKPVAGDFSEIVKQLQSITMAQQTSQEAVTKSIDQLSKVILLAAEEGVNVTAIVEAIDGLKKQMAAKNAPLDYQIDFERDARTNLMKTGVRLSAHPSRKLN